MDPLNHPSLPSLRIHQDSFESKPRKNNQLKANNSVKQVGIQPPAQFFLPLALLPMQKHNTVAEGSQETLQSDCVGVLNTFKGSRKQKININKCNSHLLADYPKTQSRSPLGIGLLHRNMLKSKVNEAKFQEEDIGKNIQRFLMISSKNNPKQFAENQGIEEQRIDKEYNVAQGNKWSKKVGITELQKKYESPVIQEMRRCRFAKEVVFDQDPDEDINEEADISASFIANGKSYRGKDKSFSVKHSYSFSDSKDSNENKSTSVECSKSTNTKGLKSFRSNVNESTTLRNSGEKSMLSGRSVENSHKITKLDAAKLEVSSDNEKNASEIQTIKEVAAEQKISSLDQAIPRKENVIFFIC